jgi:hypothetical protein
MVGIYNIYVIQRISGLNLVDLALDEIEGSKEINGMLISGLLTSFIHFTNEILHEGIKLLETNNYRLLFSYNEELIFVILMDRKGPVKFAEKVLNQMMKLFTKQFQEEITASLNGNVSSFLDISEQMKEATKLKGLKLIRHVTSKKNKKQLADFNDTFQNYINSEKQS